MGNAIISPEIKQYNRIHKAPSFSSISLWSHRGDLFKWKIFLQEKIVSYDWQYKGQMLGMDTRTVYMWLLAQMLW